MGARRLRFLAIVLSLVLIATPVLAAQPGQIQPDQEYTQTVSGNEVTITYNVSTEDSQPLREVTVEVVGVEGSLEVPNRSVTFEEIPGDSVGKTNFRVVVPEGATNGKYNVSAVLVVGNQSVDSANYTVDIHDGADTGGNAGSTSGSGDDSADIGSGEEAEGGGVVGVFSCQSWWCKLNQQWDAFWEFDVSWEGLLDDWLSGFSTH